MLGQIYSASLKQNDENVCRVIEFERITNYVMEDYFDRLAIIKAIKMDDYIVNTLAYATHNEKVFIFNPKLISLF